MSIRLRPISPEDLAAVMDIQRRAHAESSRESEPVMLEKIKTSAGFSAAAIDADGRLCGYLLAFGAPAGYVQPFDSTATPAAPPERLYIHDIAIHPDFQGRGIAVELLRHAASAARHLYGSTLVAVNNAAPYWQRLGYRPAVPAADFAPILAAYGEDAIFMEADWPDIRL